MRLLCRMIFNGRRSVKLLERPDLVEDERFHTLVNRKKNEDEINKIISEWTLKLEPEAIMEEMQMAGVPAGVVKNAADIYRRSSIETTRDFLAFKPS